ncbi:MAG TPA: glycosyltransferase [Gammaproteobacteria bacterium]
MILAVAAGIALAAWLAVLFAPWQPHRVRERIEAVPERPDLGGVTVLIPARNEAAVIERTLTALTRQGPRLEVVVVDDESSDGTAAIARRFARHAAAGGRDACPLTVRVIAGRPRPPGWSGKLWALDQGFAAVDREHVLLLDADIELAPGMIAALLRRAAQSEAALVSIMATLRSETPVERLLAPPFVFFFKLLYPFALANAPERRTAAAAGGCLLVATAALRDIGGFAAFRGALIDDCTLASLVKRRELRIWIGLSQSVRSLRAYGLTGFWHMVARTAFTQLRYSTALLLATTAAMALVFGAPFAALILAPSPGTATAGAAAIAAMSVAYLPVVRFYRLPPLWALTLAPAALLFLAMTWASAASYWRGTRARWKDRAYDAAE